MTTDKSPAAGDKPAGDAPAVEMVPKSEVLALHGRYGGEKVSWQRTEAELRAEIARLTDAAEIAAKKAPPVSDEERKTFDARELDLRERARKLEAREKEIVQTQRQASIAHLVSQYPLVRADELEAKTDLSADGLRAFAVETQYARYRAEVTKNGGKGAPAAAGVDTPGAGAGSAAAQPLSSQEMKIRGLQQRREENKAAYDTALR